ncbi:hypothetical protein BST81_14315 [Leptolyngbya sp. 'hensonii']|uniref:class I SAM-dependent methyltransferase n=1 Tax=Leptolyngbya sp. 'hensonii' TaxID=1922337 RepID=UPI00094FDF3D|nr:class I SAM-dependent methyltransferase [Leptolyngbya sp. 'hensonii']OLP17510.1 hypothetical protein BST81_14315 [Leptolyngbya sp. 'hensonii']
MSQVTDDNPLLRHLIAQHILNQPQQRISFAEYMDLVLYHPKAGYYSTQALHIGAGGDFYTSPHLGSDFGELLAEQLVQMWQILGLPVPFTLVEMGGGQGILAGDVLRAIHDRRPDCFQALQYIIVEKSPLLRAAQEKQLSLWSELRWQTLAEIPSDSITGCFFSNELVDAFPVHRVTIEDGDLRELYVTAHEGDAGPEFADGVGELSTSQLVDYFSLVGIDLLSGSYADGYRSEVNLTALDWLAAVADRLHRGYVLTIDYGYPASRYYSLTRREGTLQCYYRHTHHSDPYIHVGWQDLTAHVDFTALERWGEQKGLQTIGFTRQGLFLMALGMGERMAALTRGTDQPLAERLRRREALHGLINPMGLGNFGVLVQAKNLTPEERDSPLQGLYQPE